MLTVMTQARIPAPVSYSSMSLRSSARKMAASLRSRRQHKAWGVSPRFEEHKGSSPRMRATDTLDRKGCRPFHGLTARTYS